MAESNQEKMQRILELLEDEPKKEAPPSKKRRSMAWIRNALFFLALILILVLSNAILDHGTALRRMESLLYYSLSANVVGAYIALSNLTYRHERK